MAAANNTDKKQSDSKKPNTVQTSVRIFEDQKSYLEKNDYNLSKITRKAINEYMLRHYKIDLFRLKQLKEKRIK